MVAILILHFGLKDGSVLPDIIEDVDTGVILLEEGHGKLYLIVVHLGINGGNAAQTQYSLRDGQEGDLNEALRIDVQIFWKIDASLGQEDADEEGMEGLLLILLLPILALQKESGLVNGQFQSPIVIQDTYHNKLALNQIENLAVMLKVGGKVQIAVTVHQSNAKSLIEDGAVVVTEGARLKV